MTNARRRRRPWFAALAIAFGIVGTLGVGPSLGTTTWSRNLYNHYGFVYQDPYPTACTAAAAMMMLNFTALAHTGGGGFKWTNYRVHTSPNPAEYRDMSSMLYFERTHDTLRSTSHGSDAHGWRNALNFYGWGKTSMLDPAQRVYEDLAYGSFGSAVKAAVRSIARYNKPVGIIGWAGKHAQVMTGYVVTGADPAKSTDFVVRYVYLSDPLRSDGFVNIRISVTDFQKGNLHYRFQSYRETDSPYDDGYTAGWRRSSVSPTVGSSEWYHRWVIIAAIRDGVPGLGPKPDPTPSPTPAPTPTPTPAPIASPTARPTSTPAPEATASPSAQPSLQASPSATPTLDPSAPAG